MKYIEKIPFLPLLFIGLLVAMIVEALIHGYKVGKYLYEEHIWSD